MRHPGSQLLLTWALLAPAPCLAQSVDKGQSEEGEESSADIDAKPASSAVLVAGAYGGFTERDGGKASPYATLSLTRYKGPTYFRVAVTGYRSTLQQIDAALPSTYFIGSIGAGGNFDGWVVDGHVSFGRQKYGSIETDVGKRESAFTSSGYWNAGLRSGRILPLGKHLYLTPTLAAEYVDTKSLRHGIDMGRPLDFELPERAWSGDVTARFDRTFGDDEQSYIGVALAHHVSSNGLTISEFSPPDRFGASSTPDSWEQLGLSGTAKLAAGLWLDGNAERSFGAVAGDSTTITIGLRLQL